MSNTELMQSYLASREPPAARPKSKPKAEVKVTPRKKAEDEFNPFAQVRDLDMNLTPYTDNYWGESHYVTDEGDEEQ